MRSDWISPFENYFHFRQSIAQPAFHHPVQEFFVSQYAATRFFLMGLLAIVVILGIGTTLVIILSFIDFYSITDTIIYIFRRPKWRVYPVKQQFFYLYDLIR